MERRLWDQIQEIYHLALRMPRSERSAYLDGACKNDAPLVREITSLLRADDEAGGFLESPVFELPFKGISSSNQNHGSTPIAEPNERLVGATIDGRYLVERELGHGGVGKVYLARDVKLYHRRVVIKVLLQASLDDVYVVTKFRQEVEALSRIDHPNVVSLLGDGKLPDGKPYIAMQHVEGVNLRSQIPSEGMDLERAAAILKQIGVALDYVHEQRVFHRDLKPENIMLQFLNGGTELVKLVDFGIAKVKDSVIAPSTVNKAPIGTVLYMSPEQLRGGEKITAASDIYSMAVIAYEMITGRRPFNPSSAPQLLEMQREGVRVNPIDLRPNLSTEGRAILLRALSFDPAARYQNAAEFGDQLARALMDHGTSVQVPPEHPAQTIQSSGVRVLRGTVVPPSKVRILRYLIGGLLVVLVGIAISIYISRLEPPSNEQSIAELQPSPAERSFNYWFEVQKKRGRKQYQKPFPSSGREIFETGDKFRLNVSSPDRGYLYLFNEGPPSRSETKFTILYPTPQTKDGLLVENQLVQTNWNEFVGQTGTENLWIVWSVSPVPELEAAKIEAFKHRYGALTGENLIATKKFLMTKESEIKTRHLTNEETHQTTVRGVGDLLVIRVEVQHK